MNANNQESQSGLFYGGPSHYHCKISLSPSIGKATGHLSLFLALGDSDICNGHFQACLLQLAVHESALAPDQEASAGMKYSGTPADWDVCEGKHSASAVPVAIAASCNGY